MKRLVVPVLIAALAAGIAATGVAANPLSKTLRKTGLSPEDFDIMRQAASVLYVPAPQPGKSVTWSNAKSGSHGSAQLDRVDGQCVVVDHRVHPKGAEKAEQLKTRLCQSGDGRWLLMP
ncbi:hypothetical protein [Pukyongiella litopenaei]|uniref:Surface antigen domain-containing protein n=1 Tax=Pukyongiella litopenaei TaxID=2605946 RepID=A0A2S0MTC7_9RHOB|nr:hypothetical protein [Pukyongiella litopenaei]AVO38981.1 hypothetical protein C6Y53_15540 [Pukyongiella litopenaei]